jgi:hypothetical protein
MNVAANGNAVGNISFPSLNPILKQHFMSDRSPNNTSFNGAENKNKTEIQQQRCPGSKGYLDNIQLIAKRKLQGYGKQFHFQYDQSSSSIGTVSYSISNAINIAQVWDVTDIFNASKIENSGQSTLILKPIWENSGNILL